MNTSMGINNQKHPHSTSAVVGYQNMNMYADACCCCSWPPAWAAEGSGSWQGVDQPGEQQLLEGVVNLADTTQYDLGMEHAVQQPWRPSHFICGISVEDVDSASKAPAQAA